jgi:hypothetical protein
MINSFQNTPSMHTPPPDLRATQMPRIHSGVARLRETAAMATNMGSGVIWVIEMILWGGLSIAGHDSDG